VRPAAAAAAAAAPCRFVQIALALWQLHSKGILHRDLKSQNIFIAEGELGQV
jgi:serine/threonine protein kinase